MTSVLKTKTSWTQWRTALNLLATQASLKRCLFHSHGEPCIIYRPLITSYVDIEKEVLCSIPPTTKCALNESRAMRFIIRSLRNTEYCYTDCSTSMNTSCKIMSPTQILAICQNIYEGTQKIVILSDWMESPARVNIKQPWQQVISVTLLGFAWCGFKRSTVVGWSQATHPSLMYFGTSVKALSRVSEWERPWKGLEKVFTLCCSQSLIPNL